MFVLRLFVKFDRLQSVGSLIVGVKLKCEENFRRISHLWNVSSESLSRTVLIYLHFRRHRISPRHGSRRPARKSTIIFWRKIWQEDECWFDVPIATERRRRTLIVCRRVHKVAKKRLLASSCLSVCQFVRVEQVGFRWTDFCEILFGWGWGL
jgi:hypothetical protein